MGEGAHVGCRLASCCDLAQACERGDVGKGGVTVLGRGGTMPISGTLPCCNVALVSYASPSPLIATHVSPSLALAHNAEGLCPYRPFAS